jgi:pilus assembly protein CpaB
MNPRRLPLVIGIVLAIGTGLLLLTYVGQLRHANTAMRTVVVAVKDIPARAVIGSEMVALRERTADETDSDAIADPQKVVGRLALISIPAGSNVSGSKIGAQSAFTLPAKLTHGLRAVSISIDRVKGVSGLLQPGDRVDVIAVPPRVGNETPKASTIIRGALVLAMGNETETPHATPAPENASLTTVTLALTPQQANLIALADIDTTLRLALRSSQEPLHAYPTEPLQLGIASSTVAAAPAPPPARVVILGARAAARATPASGVVLIEGDRIVDRTAVRP